MRTTRISPPAKALTLASTFALTLAAAAAAGAQDDLPRASARDASVRQDDARMDWWREARFGLFIHWGLYAIPAGEWQGRTNHAEWILTTGQIPVARYEKFTQQFDPVRFDADQWVRLAKAAGMKYVVITSKHHDGFCLFDSARTDWDVMSTPFRRDIMKELADACRRAGLRICWYHSIMDWHHPDYLPRRGWEDRSADGADFDRYVAHLHAQVEELLTEYGDIGVMWFDGEWENTWTHEHGKALYELCRRLQPDVIVNNRVDKGRAGMAGMTTGDQFLGDFGTPEQEIPATGLPGVDWETCMTMNRHWGYNAHDEDWKSARELIRKLCDIASKGGNFLLNVGPTKEGTFPELAIERLEAIGRWMAVNGESIHGTGASPFEELAFGRCTTVRQGDTTRLYLQVFDWPPDGTLVVPGLGNEPVRAYLLAGPEPALEVARAEADLRIRVPAAAPDADCSVIVLEVKGAPIVYQAPTIAAAARVLVRPLDVELATRTGGVDIHYTLDGSTPTAGSPRYQRPLRIDATTVVKARAFHRGAPVSGVAEARFEKVAPRPAVDADGLAPGLSCRLFEGRWDALPDFSALEPVAVEQAAEIALPSGPAKEYAGRVFEGFLTVAADDVYRFALTSDDGSRLHVGDALIVDNDGLHGAATKDGTVALAAGAHPIRIEYFNKTGGAELALRLARIGAEPRPVPAAALSHRR